jgi:hypothetical protein
LSKSISAPHVVELPGRGAVVCILLGGLSGGRLGRQRFVIERFVFGGKRLEVAIHDLFLDRRLILDEFRAELRF